MVYESDLEAGQKQLFIFHFAQVEECDVKDSWNLFC